jgi:hypothetical protein
VDKDLFSGFVSAIMGFSQEVSKGKAYLKEIHLGPLKIVYDAGDLIIVTIAFGQDAPRAKINDLMKRITIRFLDKFANRLPPKIFDNNISPYAAFDEEITQIFQSTDKQGKHAVKNAPSEEINLVNLNSAVKDYLHGNQRVAFKNIDVVLKDKTGEEKTINNTLQMVKTFANRLGIDADFEPLFEKIRANALHGNEDEYAPLK